MKPIKAIVVASVLACSGAAYADIALASDTSGSIWRLDMVNRTSELLLDTHIAFQSIAASASGQLYGSTGSALYRIDLNAETTTLIGTIQDDSSQVRQTNGMAFVNGQLVGVEWNNFQSNGGSRVYSISLDDASVTDLVTSDTYAGIARGATASEDGSSILIRDNFLASIDVNTAETTRIGQTSNSNFAVELINGTFYAATNNGVVNLIDEQGRLKILHDFGSQNFRGLTAVPAPGTAAALLLGGALSSRRRRDS